MLGPVDPYLLLGEVVKIAIWKMSAKTAVGNFVPHSMGNSTVDCAMTYQNVAKSACSSNVFDLEGIHIFCYLNWCLVVCKEAVRKDCSRIHKYSYQLLHLF